MVMNASGNDLGGEASAKACRSRFIHSFSKEPWSPSPGLGRAEPRMKTAAAQHLLLGQVRTHTWGEEPGCTEVPRGWGRSRSSEPQSLEREVGGTGKATLQDCCKDPVRMAVQG